MRKEKKRSEERKYFERLLNIRYWDVLDGRDPVEHWELAEDNMSDNIIRGYAQCWNESKALVEALEHSHLDSEYSPEKKYELLHLRPPVERFHMRRDGTGDPTSPVLYQKDRATILARLVEIAKLDFGDDPDEWRRWFKAFDEDDFFPPVR